ncbi:MAG: hypothetical protein M1818_006216 [Claussenomyces sp. TS43310]|nr:MAG: hypothetical protein M1818_006216 [Claussenomyces sp. TS43310]
MPSTRHASDPADVSLLGQPLKFEFSGRTAPNRFLHAAMSERLASWDFKDVTSRGIPSESYINAYRRWGEGGFGVILTGNVMIDYYHLECAGNPIIPREAEFSGERFEAFKETARQAKAHGSLIVAQVGQAGRQVDERIEKNPVSASDVQLQSEAARPVTLKSSTSNVSLVSTGQKFGKPHAATYDEIARIIDSFAHAAEFLEQAGFDGIEFHGAHGYLIAQFLSETTNKRADQYGGSLENRMRLIMEVAAECRKRCSPSFIMGIKINSVEFQEKGFSPEEARTLCQALEAATFDFIELSGGTYESSALYHRRESTKKRESFFLDFADAIVKPLTKTKSYVSGGFKSAGAMVRALDTVDGVGIGRAVCQEPILPKEILEGKVPGAVEQDLDENDFGITLAAAGAQIRQIGEGNEPIDLSVKENVKSFEKDLEAWRVRSAQDEEVKEYKWVW